MVQRQTFINRIRELGFTYKTHQKRTSLWRKKGGYIYIAIPKAELLEEEFVTINLRRAGLDEEDIKRFIGEAKS